MNFKPGMMEIKEATLAALAACDSVLGCAQVRHPPQAGSGRVWQGYWTGAQAHQLKFFNSILAIVEVLPNIKIWR